MNKNIVTVFLLLTIASIGKAQETKEATVRKVADYLIQNTAFKFTNKKTNEVYETTKGLTPSIDIVTVSRSNRWEYVNGVNNVAMMYIAKVLNDQKYADHAKKHVDFVFSNLPFYEQLYKQNLPKFEFRPFFTIHNLDNCGAFAAGIADVYQEANKRAYRAYMDRAADYISNKQMRLSDRTFSRPEPHNTTVWADDLYMSVSLLARMGKLTGDQKYFDDAIKQVENFNKHLYSANKGLFYHAWYEDVKLNGVAHWGRSNGWVAVAQADLIERLPKNHPKRQMLINLLLRQISGFARYQDPTGLWHQVLDKPDSYLETSVTAMFSYAVAKAVNEGWIPASYLTIAEEGWKGIQTKIKPDGQVVDICMGTGISEDINYYYTRPAPINDLHGLGAIILAGAELIRADQLKVAKK